MVIDDSHVEIEQIDRVDARSRALLQFAEDASKPDVSRYGNISYDPQNHSAISSTGNLALSASDMGMETLEICNTFQTPNPYLCKVSYRLENGDIMKLPILSRIAPCDALVKMRSECDALDYKNYDFRPLAKQLGLLERDYDRLSSADGPVVRVADDQLIPCADLIIPDGTLIPLYDSRNQLIEYDVAYGDGQVYAIKIFKFIATPGIFWLPFRRERPGIWFPNGKKNHSVFDTDFKTVQANRDMAWLNDAGDLEKMDWNVTHDNDAIVWHAKANQLEARASLKHVLSIVASAKVNNRTLEVIKATYRNGDREVPFEVKRLDLTALRMEARHHHLDLPEPLRDSIFLIPLNINSVIDTSRLPTYWERGAVTGFYPEKPDCKLEILQRLVHEVVSAKLSILILIFKNERLQIEYAFAAYSHRNIACADMEVLKDTQELGRIVKENHSEMLLVMFETADEDATKNSKRLPDITQELAIQASKELQLPIGVITASAPHNASAWLYDSVYFVQKDDSTGRLQFVDKPDKAKKQPAPIKNQDKGTGIIFERECLL